MTTNLQGGLLCTTVCAVNLQVATSIPECDGQLESMLVIAVDWHMQFKLCFPAGRMYVLRGMLSKLLGPNGNISIHKLVNHV